MKTIEELEERKLYVLACIGDIRDRVHQLNAKKADLWDLYEDLQTKIDDLKEYETLNYGGTNG